jgi:hypothetical protein
MLLRCFWGWALNTFARVEPETKSKAEQVLMPVSIGEVNILELNAEVERDMSTPK